MKYFFTFTFQYRQETWDPTAIFVDPETGRPPDDLDNEVNEELSTYSFEWYPQIDFTKVFNPDRVSS